MALENDTSGTNLTLIDWVAKDEEIALTLAPVVAFVAIVMTSGVIGNSLVCYICFRKWKEKKMKYFIGFLAFFDLLTCCLCMPMEIAMLRNPLFIGSDALCKIQRFSRAITSLAAGSMLVIIAFDRYISICRHTLTRITLSQAKWLCLASFLIALVISWPAIMLFGETKKETRIIAETSCSTSPLFEDTPYPTVYYGIICVLFFAILISLVIFYTLIWIRVLMLPNLTSGSVRRGSFTTSAELSSYSQSKSKGGNTKDDEKTFDANQLVTYKKNVDVFLQNNDSIWNDDPIVKQKQNKSENIKLKSEESEDSCEFLTESSRNSTIDRIDRRRPLSARNNNDVKLNPDRTSRKFSIKCLRKMSFSSASSQMSSRSALRRRRITVTMFAITTIQIVSVIPYMALLICRNTIPDFVAGIKSTPLQVAYNAGILSHFISSGINPFVYGFCSKIFRREFKKVFCKSSGEK